MALDVKVGTFTPGGSTGNQSITGVGFQPKLVLFLTAFANSRAPTDGLAHEEVGFGAACSSTERFAWGVFSQDNKATSTITNRHFRDDACIYLANGFSGGAETVDVEFDFVSFDADGFTLDNVAGSSGPEILYLALGGDDITDVAVGQWTFTSGTGSLSVTGVGFQPDLVLFSGCSGQTNTWNDHALGFFGAAISSTEEAVLGFADRDAQSTSITDRYQRSNRCVALPYNEGIHTEAEFTSMDSDGFTINKLNAPGSNQAGYGYIALKGDFNKKIHIWDDPTSTGSHSETGVGFQPDAMILGGFGAPSNTGILPHSDFHLGFIESSGVRYTMNGQAQDAVATTSTMRAMETSMFVKHSAAGSFEVTSETDFTSFDSDGFTVDRQTDDGTDREFISLLLGSTVSAEEIIKNSFKVFKSSIFQSKLFKRV